MRTLLTLWLGALALGTVGFCLYGIGWLVERWWPSLDKGLGRMPRVLTGLMIAMAGAAVTMVVYLFGLSILIEVGR